MRLQPLLHEQAEEVFAADRQIEKNERLAYKLLQADGGVARKRAGFADDHVRRKAGQGKEFELIRNQKIISNRDIEFGALKPLQQLLMIAHHLRDAGLRVSRCG